HPDGVTERRVHRRLAFDHGSGGGGEKGKGQDPADAGRRRRRHGWHVLTARRTGRHAERPGVIPGRSCLSYLYPCPSCSLTPPIPPTPPPLAGPPAPLSPPGPLRPPGPPRLR